MNHPLKAPNPQPRPNPRPSQRIQRRPLLDGWAGLAQPRDAVGARVVDAVLEELPGFGSFGSFGSSQGR